MRELKQTSPQRGEDTRRSRTPPGVRELKQVALEGAEEIGGRTPPGVRELKRYSSISAPDVYYVAPLPGCVN